MPSRFRWRFHRQLTFDGNYVLDHLALPLPDRATWLMKGAAFMVERSRYGEHLKNSKETVEVLFSQGYFQLLLTHSAASHMQCTSRSSGQEQVKAGIRCNWNHCCHLHPSWRLCTLQCGGHAKRGKVSRHQRLNIGYETCDTE